MLGKLFASVGVKIGIEINNRYGRSKLIINGGLYFSSVY